MKCIFCSSTTNTFKSVEHIIPESLGNKEFILKKGIVCDTCNGYFSREIEGPVLRLPFFLSTRHLLNIPSKKKRIPDDKGFMIYPDVGVTVKKDREGKECFIPEKTFVKRKKSALITVVFAFPGNENLYVSKLLGKIAIELYSFLVLENEKNIHDALDQESFKKLIKYVRYGKKNEFWPYYFRPVIPPETEFQNPKSNLKYKINFHLTFIIEGNNVLFLQLLLLGAELTFDLNFRSTSNIQKWLLDINHRSLVYESALEKYNQ